MHFSSIPSNSKTDASPLRKSPCARSLRRAFLALGSAGLFASLPARAFADDPSLEIDGEAYAGQTSGAWTCGPRGVARYGGLGARVRIAERPGIAEKGAGYYGTLGGVAEYEQVRVIGCSEGAYASEFEDTQLCRVPRRHMMFGVGMAAGYRNQYVGVLLGLNVYQGYDTVSSSKPDWSSWPSFELDFGEEERGLSWPIGFGAPLVSTYRRPGVYTGPRYATQKVRLEWLVGIYRSGPASTDTSTLRSDLALQFRISERLWLGPHAALAEGEPFDGEIGLRAGLAF